MKKFIAQPFKSERFGKNNNVAIIGGGDGGVARACLENNSNYIDWFELDPEIVDACYRHLPKVCSKVKKVIK